MNAGVDFSFIIYRIAKQNFVRTKTISNVNGRQNILKTLPRLDENQCSVKVSAPDDYFELTINDTKSKITKTDIAATGQRIL